MIFFQVDAVPVAQPRQRHAVKFTKQDKAFVQNYLPGDDPVHAWKLQIQILARQAFCGNAPLEAVPISLSVKFLLPRPVSKKLPEDRSWYLSKPDLDNLVKAIKDALTGIVWKDDALVCRELTSKEYAAADENPGAAVMIEVISQ